MANWSDIFPLIHESVQSDWHRLKIVYELPLVERLWRPYRDGRLMLHRISPHESRSLYRPHPWSSEMYILAGSYRMVFGTDFRSLGTVTLTAGSQYTMDHPELWHSVSVIGERPVYSIMVTGPPFTGECDFTRAQANGTIPTPGPQPKLEADVTAEILSQFKLLVGSRFGR